MLTLPLVPVDRSHIGEVAWTKVDRRVSFDASYGRPADAPVGAFWQAAQTLRLGPAALDALIAELPVGVLVVDGDGEVSYANAVARSLGATTMPSLQRVVARALLSDQVVCEEFAVEPAGARGRLDARRRLAVRAVPFRNVGASAHAAVVTVNDITAQTQANAWEPAIASLMSL